MSATITANGLKDMQRFFDEFPDIAEQAAVLAINDTIEREGLTSIKQQMRKEVNFPAGYLEDDRLVVARRAQRGRLEGVIRGRDRPTSLARFAEGQTPENTKGRGVRVRVQKGQSELMKRAFIVRLNNGRSLAVAVRLKPGEKLRNSQAAVALDNNVYLLYGPSVDQVLRGVAVDQTDELLDMVASKFIRQFGRLSGA